MARRVPLLLLVAAACLPVRATDEVTYGSTSVMDEGPPPPPGQQKISFKPPQLDEEESESVALPDVYRCHACAAVAYQVESQYVARTHRRRHRSRWYCPSIPAARMARSTGRAER